MMLRKQSWLIFLALAAVRSLPAAEITGKVRDASGDAATVVIDGDALPAVGDSAEIFFKVPGADEEISVANGKVAAVDAKVVKIKIEKSTGTIAKDQLARIRSGSAPQTSGASPAATSSPSGTVATGSSIAGDWTITEPDGTKISFGFKEDGTLLWVVEDAQYAQSTLAKYRIDPSTQPQGIEFFDIEAGEVKFFERMRGIFELQSDGRLKLEFPKGPDAPPLKEFTEKMLFFSKPSSPVVRPNKPARPTPTPYVAPTPSPDEALVTEGKQRYERGDDAGAMEALEKAIVLNPKSARAYFYRGLVFSRKKEWTPAIDDFQKAMELDPSMKLEDLILETRAHRLEEREKAAASPASTPSPKVRQLIDKGIELHDRRELNAAVESLTKAIKLDPKAVDAYFWRGSCYDLQNEHAAAIRDWNEVMNLDPSQRESRQKLMDELNWSEKAKKEQQSKKR